MCFCCDSHMDQMRLLSSSGTPIVSFPCGPEKASRRLANEHGGYLNSTGFVANMESKVLLHYFLHYVLIRGVEDIRFHKLTSLCLL